MVRVNNLVLMLVLCGCTACSTIGYYHQSINGHLLLLSKREPIANIVNDSARDEKLIAQLILAQQLRTFASTELKLPDNDSYRSYVRLDKPFVTWNVFAAPQLSTRLQQWCFLIIGCVAYRGYYNANDAHSYAQHLNKLGLDTYVGGVPAYSTLGWSDDPLLSSMLDRGEIVTAAYIFHELAHQQFYAKNDSAFNEAFATAVEELGVRHWLQQQQRADELEKYQDWLLQKAVFMNFIKTARQEFEQLYAQELTAQAKRLAKNHKIAELRQRFENLTTQHDQLSRYASWMSGPLNNAQLGAIALYGELVPAFTRIFVVCDSDFARFYKRAEEIAKLPVTDRESVLHTTNECQW